MNPSRPPAAGPAAIRFSPIVAESGTGLFGPPPGRGPRAMRRGLVTGGGLVAALEPTRGLIGLWLDGGRLLSRVEVWNRSSRARTKGPFRWGRGGWGGAYDLDGGFRLVEKGLLPDSTPAAVFQWTVEAPFCGEITPDAPTPHTGTSRPEVRIVLMAGPLGPVHEVTLPLVAGATAAIVGTPPDVEVRSAERLVTPLSVRERQRSERGRSSDEPGFSVSRDGQAVPSIVEALRHIDDAAVAGPGPTAHRDIFGGVAGGVPEALVGDALCLYGTGAVYAGRTWLAARALASLQERAQSHPAPYLALAATYALWTADLEPFASTTRTLAVAVDALERGGVRHGSAPIKELVERLSAAIEPLGDTELSARLRASARTPLAESAASVRGLGRSVPGIEGSLRHTGRPPPRECLSASRFIRRLVGRELGLEPDAAFGRLRFAPRLGLLSGRLDVAGLRTGDARVRIGISRSGASSELRIHQEAGRVPLNLVFAPWLATSGSASLTVLLDGSPVEPDVRPSAGGTRVQMQFPLDRPREVAIFVGSP